MYYYKTENVHPTQTQTGWWQQLTYRHICCCCTDCVVCVCVTGGECCCWTGAVVTRGIAAVVTLRHAEPQDAAYGPRQWQSVSHVVGTRALRSLHGRVPTQTHRGQHQVAATLVRPIPGKWLHLCFLLLTTTNVVVIHRVFKTGSHLVPDSPTTVCDDCGLNLTVRHTIILD